MENKYDIPMGLAFPMSMNERAMENFARMTEEEKRQVLEAARNTSTKEQIRGIVSDLSNLE